LLQDVLPGSPAHLAGKLKKGDTILQVDGEDVRSSNIVAKIKGDDVPGSSVSIQVTRAGRKRPLEVTVLRARKESVDYTKKTFELLSELAQMGGANEAGDDIEGPATSLEKELKARLIAMEHEKLQQEVVLDARTATNDRMLSTVKALIHEFSGTAASKFGAPTTASSSQAASSSGRDGGFLRDAALKVGRASQILEESCMTLRTRVAGKLMGMNGRLKRVSEMSELVRESLHEEGRLGGVKSELETSAASAHVTMKLSNAATKLVQLQEKVADRDDQVRKLREQIAGLVTQVETSDLKISLLESKAQLQTAHLSARGGTPSGSSAEPGGPGVESSGVENRRLAAEVIKLRDDMQRQQQEFDEQMGERDASLTELSSSLFAAQDRASASMSELVTLRMENLKLKEQAVEKERKSASDRNSVDEVVVQREQLEKQRKAYEDLEALYMQAQQKYVAASQEVTRKTRELSEARAEAEAGSNDLKGMLRRESDQLQEARNALADTQEQIGAAQAAKEAVEEQLAAAEERHKALEEQIDSRDKLRKDMEEAFSRERQDGINAMRERDSLKKQRNTMRLELEAQIQALREAKDLEIEEKVREEQLRWKRNFEIMEAKIMSKKDKDAARLVEALEVERDQLLAELNSGEMERKDAADQVQSELEARKREAVQAKRERDSLKVEMDESRYVIGQLTAEVTDLRSKANGGGRSLLHGDVPWNVSQVQQQRSVAPIAQRAGPGQSQAQQRAAAPFPPPPITPPVPMLQLNPPSPPNHQQHPSHPQHPSPDFTEVMSPRGVSDPRDNSPQPSHSSHSSHASADLLSLSRSGSQGFPPQQRGGPNVPGDVAGAPSKPVGVYSNRAGRLFAM
jgi:hypothetical protein